MERTRLGVLGLLALTAAGGTVQGAVIDLTTPGSFGVVNGARFETADFRPAGTGFIDSFLRIQNTGIEHGYNTSARPVPLDGVAGNFTRDLRLGEILTREIGGVSYYEFILDINQIAATPNNLLSLDKVQIYTSNIGGQSTSDPTTLGTLRYDLGDNWIRLDANLSSGSGQGDMRMFIPVANFAGLGGNTFVYLYSMFGVNHAANNGFEEWAVVIPLPPAAWAGGGMLGLLALMRIRRLRTD
jgi:hypothetical protein